MKNPEILPFPIPWEIERDAPVAGKSVPLIQLQNEINRINFKDGTIVAVFRHRNGERTIALPVTPLPCDSRTLRCSWYGTEKSDSQPYLLDLACLLVEDTSKLLYVKPMKAEADRKGLIVELPEQILILDRGSARTFPATGIVAKIFQNGMSLEGELRFFWGGGFEVSIFFQPPQVPPWIDRASDATLLLLKGPDTLYVGKCRISGLELSRHSARFQLSPLSKRIHRFKARKFRSERIELRPPPEMFCTHPLSGTLIALDLFDLSSSGFSIRVDPGCDLFPVGLILPDLEIRLAEMRMAKCKVQVVHRSGVSDKTDEIQCGMAIIEAGEEEHSRIESIVQRVHDTRTSINARVNMDDLWDFFFKTGFIYPEKYQQIEKHKSQVKKAYKRLYMDHPNIARNFIYRDSGIILGHIAMLRFYETCWMIHHHSARTSVSRRAGFMVLEQVSRFIKNSRTLPSLRLDYACTFYRPENRFPSRIFGGVTSHLNNSQVCSVDRFAFFHIPREEPAAPPPTETFQLTAMGDGDFRQLEEWYMRQSGGLLIRAFDFEPDDERDHMLSCLYDRIGFQRKRKLLSLRQGPHLVAVIEILISDFGLNLSRLTEGLKVIVIDENILTSHVLKGILASLSLYFRNEFVPILLFPFECAARFSFKTKTSYNLWIMDTQYSDPYFEYISRFFKKSRR